MLKGEADPVPLFPVSVLRKAQHVLNLCTPNMDINRLL